jgi:hypothetical protein
MKKKISIMFMFCVLVSCASVPEPSFKDGVYSNPEFGFRASMPAGWINSTPIPPWVLPHIPESEAPGLKFMFTNSVPQYGITTKGRILASCSMLKLSWEEVMADRGKFRLLQIKILDDRKAGLSANPLIKDYFSKTYSLTGHRYPFHLFEEKIDAYEIRIIRNSFLYRCNDTGACYLVFYLLSPSDRLQMNYKAYQEVINSMIVQ